MGDSRRSPPADPVAGASREAIARVCAALDAALAAHHPPGSAVAVALSGGRDSMVLLDACAQWASGRAVSLHALHVHHGLSPDADRWSAFCAREAASRSVPFVACKVTIGRSPAEGIEASARTERYRALGDAARDAGIRCVLLAHHLDDQAETLLLQLARGAGPHGLSAMPAVADSGGIRWVRPLLELPRSVIDAYARERNLPFVEDASNADTRHRRNAVRTLVAPALAQVFPGYPRTLGRAARLQAEAARLADDLALQDAGDALDAGALAAARLSALPDHRARNLLRWFLRAHALRPPSEARLAAMLRQLRSASVDAQVRLSHDGVEIGLYRGRIVVHGAAPADYAVEWRGEAALDLPHGRLEFLRRPGEGIALARIAEHCVVVRPRRGGERLAPAPERPRRSLKHLLQEAGLPPWQRRSLPLLFCDDVLVAVPGIGVDADWRVNGCGEGVSLRWHAAAGVAGRAAR